MSKLINGNIPAHTICPFKGECNLASNCHHQGEKHPVPFSCAAARGFDLIKISKKA